MSYDEREQERLLQLWRDGETDEEAIGSESETEPEDHIKTEQEISDEDLVAEEKQMYKTCTEKRPFFYLWEKDRKTKWTEYPRNLAVRTRQVDILRMKLPYPKNIAREAVSPLECWVKETDVDEIKAVLGLLYLAGLFRSNRQNLKDLWASDGTGIEIFRSTMALKRFQFLLACLRFDDQSSRADRRSLDKLAPIRAIFDRFVDHCKESYAPSQYPVTIDEKLEAF
ncbi:hypothetical protein NQ318_006979 [Aromia moschata]|uniref:Death domain-containing protein n=1 Tax=Aromia moschata TaxID=1265417 RepID=A0AAV8X955_9CUCU|nr:hypothetical protein NQ318_006979 [Aromia moschata]